MRYTEEEFFGNKQNTQDEENIENNKNTKAISLTILTTFLKTALVLVCSVFYCFVMFCVLLPKSSAKLLESIGADETSLFCYERIYLKSKNLDDLYNLVQKSIECGQYKKTAKYINEMKNNGGYSEFCIEVNNAVICATEAKYIAYVGDLDSYLVAQEIIAEYNLGNKNKALTLALEDLNNNNIYSFGLSAYIETLDSDANVSDGTIKSTLVEIYNKTLGTKKVFEKVEERRNMVVHSSDDDKTVKILKTYTALKIENIKQKFYKALEDDVRLSETLIEIEELQEQYNELVG